MSLLCQIEMTLPRMFREVPGVTVRLMSDKELARLEVLRDLDQQRLTPTAAAQLLGLERRQVFRLLKAYRAEGAAGLISKRRGRPSNRRQPAELRATALAIIRERYLAGASCLAEGNALLPSFMADYNARFAKPPANGKDLHRPLREEDNLEDAFAWKEERTLSRALT